MIDINPGSDPVPNAWRSHADINMGAFMDDLTDRGLPVAECVADLPRDRDGRYAYTVTFTDGRTVQVDMPGRPTDQVRYMYREGQNPFDFPRLHVDGSSWLWLYALGACEPDQEGDRG